MSEDSGHHEPRAPLTIDTDQERPARFTEVFSPPESMPGLPRPGPPQGLPPPIPNATPLDSSESSETQVTEEPSQVDVDQEVMEEAGMFGSNDEMALFDVSPFRSPIAGYFNGSYNSKGGEFHDALRKDGQMKDVKLEYDDLWLQVQLFWDLMLRMQPNAITSNPVYTSQAVNMMLDAAVGRLFTDIRPEYYFGMAHKHVMAHSRRLRRLELILRNDMVTCGKPPKMLCGCMVAVKRPKKKSNIWTRLFGFKPGEQKRTPNSSFRIRDVAGLIRMEDFLTFVSHEFDRQLGRSTTRDETSIILIAMGFMDDEIKSFLPKRDYHNAAELKSAWVYVLCGRRFRNAVVREVQGLVNEAQTFRKKHGYTAHTEQCELWTGPRNGIARMLSSTAVLKSAEAEKDNPLRPAFWRSESKGFGK
ncbi:hypothetical protein NM208_g13146 [Fusarium decemcellulare]|uniref:Uncharacterized protein n=1 Tax=Fusarium decemcellulare TaxID=57161 RepID=A0ACC1RKY5_9HYPO|nr:hypothetical protein NM208_g13146 [Fusarium decemcellulare]